MRCVTTFMALCLVFPLAAAAAPVAATKALAKVESSNRARAIGDKGRAAGKHQFHAKAWAETSKYRQQHGLETWAYSHALDPKISDFYAASRLRMLTEQLSSRLNRPPTAEEVYAAYNLGLAGFKKRNYKVAKCPVSTRRQAAKFSILATVGGD